MDECYLPRANEEYIWPNFILHDDILIQCECLLLQYKAERTEQLYGKLIQHLYFRKHLRIQIHCDLATQVFIQQF